MGVGKHFLFNISSSSRQVKERKAGICVGREGREGACEPTEPCLLELRHELNENLACFTERWGISWKREISQWVPLQDWHLLQFWTERSLFLSSLSSWTSTLRIKPRTSGWSPSTILTSLTSLSRWDNFTWSVDTSLTQTSPQDGLVIAQCETLDCYVLKKAVT